MVDHIDSSDNLAIPLFLRFKQLTYCGIPSHHLSKTLCHLYSGLEILAFPCNQFGAQEPGSVEEIQNFVCTRFKAEFPVFDKVDITHGFILCIIINFHAARTNAPIMALVPSIPTFWV